MDLKITGIKVSVLMYADDIEQLSQTENGLQRGINALHSFVQKQLNSKHEQIKLMYVSKRRPTKLLLIEFDL